MVIVVGDFGLLRSQGEIDLPTNLCLWFNIACFAHENF
jgi:hypothetical protein